MRLSCGACLAPTLEVRWDRRGCPWTSCRACGTRAFLRSLREVAVLSCLSPLLAAAAEEIAQPGSDLATRLEATMRALLAASREPVAGAPVNSATPVREVSHG